MKKLIALIFVLIVILGAGLVYRRDLLSLLNPGTKDHPGTILRVENPGGKETVLNADEVPLRNKFVFLKDGHEVSTKKEADTIIPIVRVDVFLGPDKSVLEIHEQGPNGQSLRRTYGGN